MSEDMLTVRVLQRGIEQFEAITDRKPHHITLTSKLMAELQQDPEFFELCTEVSDPCAEYEVRGVKLFIDNRLSNEARMQ